MPDLGLDCKLYRGTAGALADTLMKNVRDVSFNVEKGLADVTTRAASGWRINAGTLKEGTLEFGMLYDKTDADLQAIQSAFLNNTALAFLVAHASGEGFSFDGSVTSFNDNQPLEEGVEIRVTVKPTVVSGSAARYPTWATAASGGGGE